MWLQYQLLFNMFLFMTFSTRKCHICKLTIVILLVKQLGTLYQCQYNVILTLYKLTQFTILILIGKTHNLKGPLQQSIKNMFCSVLAFIGLLMPNTFVLLTTYILHLKRPLNNFDILGSETAFVAGWISILNLSRLCIYEF